MSVDKERLKELAGAAMFGRWFWDGTLCTDADGSVYEVIKLDEDYEGEAFIAVEPDDAAYNSSSLPRDRTRPDSGE